MMSLRQAAMALGVETKTLNVYAKRLDLPKFGNSYAISDEDFIRLKDLYDSRQIHPPRKKPL